MQRKTWWIGGASALALVAALAWAFAPRPMEVELAEVTQGRFELTVDEDAKTRLADRFTVSAPLAGRLSRISLREGDAVAADMPVAVLTPALPAMLDERTQRELQARVQSAEDNVARAATRVERARVGLEQAANDARRSEQLAQQGFVAPTKLESDRLATRAAQRETESAAAERRMAAHDLEQARAALTGVRTPSGASAPQRSFVVRAPVAGRVLRVLQTSEATVAMGTPLLELGDVGRLEVVVELLTTDAVAAQPGSRVRIERWGGAATLEGRLRSVEPAAFTKVSALGVEEQRVRAVIDITSPRGQWAGLGDGFRVSVRIVTLSQDDAIQVPVSAVFPLPAQGADTGNGEGIPEPRFGVFVVDGRNARLTPIALGARNAGFAWVRSGLGLGQSVVVYPPMGLKDGSTVRERRP